MEVAYIAGPYSAGTIEGIEQNVKQAIKIGAKYARKGYAVHTPHANSHYMDQYFNQDGLLGYEDWLEKDIAVITRCDVVVFIPGWENSKGARIEHMIARALGKKIIYDGGGEHGESCYYTPCQAEIPGASAYEW